jgi:hypothetical protein
VLRIQPNVGSDDAAYARLLRGDWQMRLLRADWQMRRIAAGLGSPVPKLVNKARLVSQRPRRIHCRRSLLCVVFRSKYLRSPAAEKNSPGRFRTQVRFSERLCGCPHCYLRTLRAQTRRKKVKGIVSWRRRSASLHSSGQELARTTCSKEVAIRVPLPVLCNEGSRDR